MSTSTQDLRLVEDPGVPGDTDPTDGWHSDFERPAAGGTSTVPVDLDLMAPGPRLGSILGSIDVDALGGYDRVVVLRAHQRMVAHHQAQSYQAMLSIRDAYQEVLEATDEESNARGAAAEVRCALHLTRRAADGEMVFAMDLAKRLPAAFSLLNVGRLDVRRAKTIDRGTCHLTDCRP